jgi:hypothetical protein
MKSVDFSAANVPLAKDQPEYNTLYVRVDRQDPYYPMTACMQFSPEEIAQIVKTGKIWVKQCTMGRGYHPISITTEPPFDNPDTTRQPADENRTAAAVWDQTHFLPVDLTQPEGTCINCNRLEWEHFWSERQCEL